MTEPNARVENVSSQWTFSCNVCPYETDVETEAEALNAADFHADYGPGHFDFTITDPEGVEQYP